MLANHQRAAIASFDSVLITVWRRDVEKADVGLIEPVQQRLIREYGSFASLAVAGPDALKMAQDARAEAARIAERGETANRGIALVIARTGFTGAALRATVAAVHLLSRSKVPQRAFAGLDEATRFIHQSLGAPASWAPRDLALAVAGLDNTP